MWRLLLFGGALLFIQPIAESVLAPLFAALSNAVGEPVAVFPWIVLTAVWFAIVLALRLVDDAPWSSIALGPGAWRPKALVVGLLLGVSLIVLTALALFAGGWLHFEPVRELAGLDGAAMLRQSSWNGGALRWLVLLAPAALWEELVFRGYLWTVIEDATGPTAALAVTSVLFGFVHLQNPGSGVRTTALVVLAGICLGLVRLRTGSLPAAWMAHLAWNWTMAAVLHVPVSGLPVAPSGYRAVVSGPAWLTGGEWGPEGGAVAALTLGGALCIALRDDMKRLTNRLLTIHRARA